MWVGPRWLDIQFDSPYPVGAAYRVNARCNKNSQKEPRGCMEGGGLRFQFTGSWLSLRAQPSYSLEVCTTGDHVGAARPLRKKKQGSATKDMKQAVHQACEYLASAGMPVTALAAKGRVEGCKQPCPKSTSLRGLVSRWAKKKGVRASAGRIRKGWRAMRKVTWSAEFSRLVTELANDDVIKIKDVSPGPVITCFTLVFTGTLQYLK